MKLKNALAPICWKLGHDWWHYTDRWWNFDHHIACKRCGLRK